MLENELILNSEEGNFYNELLESFDDCINYKLSVAFINWSGLQLILDSFSELERRNITGKIITSTYLGFTDPKAIRRLSEI
ncbi:MAG: hypothetical protein NT084_12995, partial [Bacteroidetes bacterium]|nr:hypothetical protein [Bacteroidota bacterium]